VLTVNAGSSSVRLALARIEGTAIQIVHRARHDRADTTPETLGTLVAKQSGPLAAVVHRVVHGGVGQFQTRAFDGAVEADVAAMTPLAPLHNPATLEWLGRARAAWPDVPHLAVFDSGFFADLPAVATTYALPAELRNLGDFRRLGFHGLAHRSMWQAFAQRRPGRGRVISFQLGSGCSAAALVDGRPRDTSMGFTPLEGLVMATRTGDLDPGLLLYLLTEKRLAPEHLAQALTDRSGLAGLSGLDGDMRQLLASASPEAELAIDVFCYRARKYFGAYLAALGGCDAVLLGGGVGESAPVIRKRMLAGLEGLGLALDEACNDEVRGEGRISRPGSAIEVWVVPTDEESVMAEEAALWLRAQHEAL
jgi:acetate kinase